MVLDQTLTRRDIKRNNRLRIYNRLREAGSFSCLDISMDLGLSLPTVGKNISDLEEAGLVRSSEEKKNTGGRSSKLYEVVADYRVAIGVNITNQHISAVAIDLQGTVVAHTRFRQAFARCDDYYKKLGAAVQTVVLEAGLQDDQILGVGLVIPGLLTKDGESTYYSRVLRLDTDMTCEEISAYIPYQTRFFHDASSAAYAESWYNHDETDFFYMMISDSICGAPILDAHPYRGMNFRSGEIGHVQLIRGGRQCYCGKRGCLDAYCNTKVLATVTKGDLALFFEELEKGEERVQDQVEGVSALSRDSNHGGPNALRLPDRDWRISGTVYRYLYGRGRGAHAQGRSVFGGRGLPVCVRMQDRGLCIRRSAFAD